MQLPENQVRVLEYGFRPGNPEVRMGAPIELANGVDPSKPSTLLEVPSGQVMNSLLDAWAVQRKGARVLMVLDVSGSMGEPADLDDPNGPTKLDLAKRAVIEGIDDFKSDDQVGLRIFTTDGNDKALVTDLSPIAPIGAQRESLIRQVDSLTPLSGTPLYKVAHESYAQMLEGYDPELINAVILLTDGQNDDGTPADDARQFAELLADVKNNSDGESARNVRIFTLAYGTGTDPAELRQIAEASNATAYQAGDATTINKVFAAVVSNF
ncbi:MAG: VWA domain-containing protein [Microthrixaceae bacterium]